MKLRNKILLYFSCTVIILSTIAFSAIYVFFAEYRKDEFRQRQKEKILLTIQLLNEYKEMAEDLTAIMDKLTIHDFYDEKMLIFDQQKDLIYQSVDDLPINNYVKMLNDLSPSTQSVIEQEEQYDLVGLYVVNNNTQFYGISKAYDAFGYSKLNFLKNSLISSFFIINGCVILIAFFISQKVSTPITRLSSALSSFKAGQPFQYQPVHNNTFELNNLNEKFIQLVQRTNEAFDFQKHTIHHISHELKTPIAILVSEMERLHKNVKDPAVKADLSQQIDKAKSLGTIISVLLEISKFESGNVQHITNFRIDELIFDNIEEVNILHPGFQFEVNYNPASVDENNLLINGNKMLIKQALLNLIVNCIQFADNEKAEIIIDAATPHQLKVQFINSGNTISKEEEKFMFNHFFRGENSFGKTGFGLGLVLTKKIVDLHQGEIEYKSSYQQNIFELTFPIS